MKSPATLLIALAVAYALTGRTDYQDVRTAEAEAIAEVSEAHQPISAASCKDTPTEYAYVGISASGNTGPVCFFVSRIDQMRLSVRSIRIAPAKPLKTS